LCFLLLWSSLHTLCIPHEPLQSLVCLLRSEHQLFLNFVNVLMSLIENLQPNQQLVLPGGLQRTEYGHLCQFSFTVCNTGRDGLQYHPSSFDSETGRQLKQMAMTIWNIPALRIMHSTFWVVFFRMQVYPSKRNSAEFLYTNSYRPWMRSPCCRTWTKDLMNFWNLQTNSRPCPFILLLVWY